MNDAMSSCILVGGPLSSGCAGEGYTSSNVRATVESDERTQATFVIQTLRSPNRTAGCERQYFEIMWDTRRFVRPSEREAGSTHVRPRCMTGCPEDTSAGRLSRIIDEKATIRPSDARRATDMSLSFNAGGSRARHWYSGRDERGSRPNEAVATLRNSLTKARASLNVK